MKRRGLLRNLLAIVSAGVAVVLPVGACPACYPAYAAVLSSLGLPFLGAGIYPPLIASVLVALCLFSLSFRAGSRGDYRCLFVGVAGAVVFMVGRFIFDNPFVFYPGAGILVFASPWQMFSGRKLRPRVEVLYFEGCPTYRTALATVEEVLGAEGIEAEIRVVELKSEEDARKLRFPGSPTVRVNGMDVVEGASSLQPALACRMYQVPEGGIPPYPSKQIILEAFVREGLIRRRTSCSRTGQKGGD